MNGSTVLVNEISIQYMVERFLIMLYLSLECETGLKESSYSLELVQCVFLSGGILDLQ